MSNKKKVGILTWHYIDNYGSALQAYAMQKLFSDDIFEAEFINYRENAKSGCIYDFLRKVKYHMPTKSTVLRRRKKFYKFHKENFSQSKIYGSIEQLKKAKLDYDMIVCGSDQIWSSKQFNEVYFLNFANSIPKYSYAASTIQDDYNKEQREIIKNCLNDFSDHGISVRERIGVKIIKKLTNKSVTEVLDPTLLLDKKEWDKLIDKRSIKEKYLVCYFIGEKDKYERITKQLKEKYHCEKIININIKEVHNFGDNILKDASPNDFLNLIKYAEVVVSDSYHAILFAINFNKEFYAIKRFEENENDNQNERIYNILRKINCENRYISYQEKKLDKESLDYKQINKKLHGYVLKSKNYIARIKGEK